MKTPTTVGFALLLAASSMLVVVPSLGGCAAGDGDGDGDAGTPDGGLTEVDAGPPFGSFTLTSPTLVDGGVMPVTHTCDGANTSPGLSWASAPSGTAGFGLVFTDTSIGLIHTVMWDIPGDATSLPSSVENVYAPSSVPGAKQTQGYDNSTRGWLGPCPPNEHTYVLTLYAVSERPMAGLDEGSTRAEVESALEAAALGTATLTVTYDP